MNAWSFGYSDPDPSSVLSLHGNVFSKLLHTRKSGKIKEENLVHFHAIDTKF